MTHVTQKPLDAPLTQEYSEDMSATKSDAHRWFSARVGRTVDTKQFGHAGHLIWSPGVRMVESAPYNRNGFVLDGSYVAVYGNEHRVVEVAPSYVEVEWFDEAGLTIHTTVYSDPV